MLIIDSRTVTQLADKLTPLIAERLAARPRPGDLVGDPEKLLTETEAAAILGLRPQTLCAWRCRGQGPAFVRLDGGRKRRAPIRYRCGVILAVRDAHTTDPEQ